MFASFKGNLERYVHSAFRLAIQLDALTVACNICDAYEQRHIGAIIRSGFGKGGVWDYSDRHATLKPLRKLPFYTDPDSLMCGDKMPTLDDVVNCFNNRHRDLIADNDVAISKTARVDTTHAAHLSSSLDMGRVHEDEARRTAAHSAAERRAKAAREKAEDAARMIFSSNSEGHASASETKTS